MEKGQSKSGKGKFLNIFNVDSLIDTILKYFEKRVELIKIEVKEEVAAVGSKLIIGMITGFLMLFLLLFISILSASLINEVYDSQYIGYLYVTGFYILLIVIIQVLRRTADLDSKLEELIYDLLSKGKQKTDSEANE
jgi:uncharacterized membrane protein YqjE